MSNATATASTLFLGHNANWWDFWLLVSVVVVAPLAAAIIGFTTTGSVISNKREAAQAKHELQIDQAKTAGKVADAKKAGIEAGERAGHAQTTADATAVELATQKTLTKQAEAEAANAVLAAERLKADNLATERLLTPRRWLGPSGRGSPTLQGLWAMVDRQTVVGSFAGTRVLIQVVPDFESQRLANDMIFVFRGLGWRPEVIDSRSTGIEPLSIPEGVQIWTRKPSDEASIRAWDAAEAVAHSMSDEGITGEKPSSKLHLDTPEGIWSRDDIRVAPPEGVVFILVGMKPATAELWQRAADRLNGKE